MDIANQEKMDDGYIQSFAGYYKLYTSNKPTENISATVVKTLTEVG